MVEILRSVNQEAQWFPADISYYWTPRVLVCREANTPWDFYESFLQVSNQCGESGFPPPNGPDAPEPATKVVFTAPDPRWMQFMDVPQVANSMASIFWRGVLLYLSKVASESSLRYLQRGTELFQRASLGRGIEKVSVVVCETEWTERDRSQFVTFCEERGISTSFIHITLAEVTDSVALKSNARYRSAVGSFAATTYRELMRQISVRVESDAIEQDLMASQEAEGAARGGSLDAASTSHRRQNADAKMRKQRADCALLLDDALVALGHYTAANDLYRLLNHPLGQAVCCEGIAAGLMRYCDQRARSGRKSAKLSPTATEAISNEHESVTTPVSAAYATSPASATYFWNPGVLNNLPQPVENIVKEALMPKRGGGSLFQNLFPDRTTPAIPSTLSELTSTFEGAGDRVKAERSRRASVAPPSAAPATSNENSGALMMAAAVAKLKEAANFYQKVKPDPDCAATLATLTAASVLVHLEERQAALEALNHVLEECLLSSSSLMPYLVLACSAHFLKLKAIRKYAWSLHQLDVRLTELAGTIERDGGSVDRNIWRLIHKACLLLSPHIHLPPHTFLSMLDRPPALDIQPAPPGYPGPRLIDALVMSIRRLVSVNLSHTDILSYIDRQTSLELSTQGREFFAQHLREATFNRYDRPSKTGRWPAIQATTLDRLRKASDHLHLSVNTLWYAYAGLLLLYGSFDARSQTSAQRLLAMKELQLQLSAKMGPVGALDPKLEISREHTVPWVVPPSLTVMSPLDQDPDWGLHRRLRCLGPLSYRSQRRRVPPSKPRSGTTGRRKGKLEIGRHETRLTFVGGVGGGLYPYVPVVLGLKPQEVRKMESTRRGFTGKIVSRVIPRPSVHDRPGDVLPLSGDNLDGEVFLYKPWDDEHGIIEDHPQSYEQRKSVYWAVGDLHRVTVCIRNPLAIDILLDHCKLLTEGVEVECQPLTVGLPPTGQHDVAFEALLVPRAVGMIYFLGLGYMISRVATAQCLCWDSPELGDALLGTDTDVRRILASDDLLRRSAYSSVSVVPALPTLHFVVKPAVLRNEFKQDYIKLSSKASSEALDPFDSRPRTAMFLSQAADISTSAPLRGQMFCLEILLKNTTAQNVDDLWLTLVPQSSENRPTNLAASSGTHQVTFEDGELAECLRLTFAQKHLRRLVTGPPRREPLRAVFDVNSVETYKEKLSVAAGSYESIHIEGLASEVTRGFIIRALYAGSDAEYLREDSVTVNLGYRPGLAFVPKSLRFYNDFVLPLHHLLPCAIASHLYSLEARTNFHNLLLGLENVRSEFDSPDTLVVLDLTNEADVAFRCEILPRAQWLDDARVEGVFGTNSFRVDPLEDRRRLSFRIKRFLTPGHPLQQKYEHIMEVLDELMDIWWRADPDLEGRLFFVDMIRDIDLSLGRSKSLASASREARSRIAEDRQRNMAGFASLTQPRISLRVEIKDREGNLLRPATNDRSIAVKLYDMVRVVVSVRLASAEGIVIGKCSTYVIPYSSDKRAEGDVNGSNEAFCVAGSLEAHHAKGLHRAETICQELALVPTVPGLLHLATTLYDDATHRFHWHHKPITLLVR